MLTYIAMLMTSWAIVCDIDYLPPTELKVVMSDITLLLYDIV